MAHSREDAAIIAAKTEALPFALVVYCGAATHSFHATREAAETAAPAGAVYTVVDTRVHASHRRHLESDDLDDLILRNRGGETC